MILLDTWIWLKLQRDISLEELRYQSISEFREWPIFTFSLGAISYGEMGSPLAKKRRRDPFDRHSLFNAHSYFTKMSKFRGGGTPYNGLWMLRPKGIPFWAPGMRKRSLFQAGGMWKGYLSSERYVKGCQFWKFSMWKGSDFPKFSMLKGKGSRPQAEHLHIWNRLEYPHPPLEANIPWHMTIEQRNISIQCL